MSFYTLKDRKMIKISFQDISNQEKVERGDKIAIITLLIIFILLFCASSLETMLFFLFSGLMIGFLYLKRRNRK
jgi:hypothetical protein